MFRQNEISDTSVAHLDVTRTLLLSECVVDVAPVRLPPSISAAAAQRHQLVGGEGAFHVGVVAVVKHVPGLISAKKKETLMPRVLQSGRSIIHKRTIDEVRRDTSFYLYLPEGQARLVRHGPRQPVQEDQRRDQSGQHGTGEPSKRGHPRLSTFRATLKPRCLHSGRSL